MLDKKILKFVIPIVMAAILAGGIVGIINALNTPESPPQPPSAARDGDDHPTEQHSILWYLDCDLEMERYGGPGDDGQSGSVDITEVDKMIWIADEPAACNLTFPAEEWTVQITRDTTVGEGHQSFLAFIGIWDPDGGKFTDIDYAEGQIARGDNHGTAKIDCEEFTVSAGDYLALMVVHPITVVTDGTSYVAWPLDEPPYPVPEIPTIALMAAGLLCLGGYLGLRRHTRKGTIR